MTSLANHDNQEESESGRLVLLKGEAARQAVAIEMVKRSNLTVEATGPWAADIELARGDAEKSGFAQGLAEGREAGKGAALEEAKARSAEAISALDGLIKAMEEREEALEADFPEHVAEMALVVAEAILSREIAAATDPGKEAIARCLTDAPRGGEVIANLHPKDIESLGHLESVLQGRPVTVVPDPSLQRGDTIIQVGETRIDGRLCEAIDRVREALR